MKELVYCDNNNNYNNINNNDDNDDDDDYRDDDCDQDSDDDDDSHVYNIEYESGAVAAVAVDRSATSSCMNRTRRSYR